MRSIRCCVEIHDLGIHLVQPWQSGRNHCTGQSASALLWCHENRGHRPTGASWEPRPGQPIFERHHRTGRQSVVPVVVVDFGLLIDDEGGKRALGDTRSDCLLRSWVPRGVIDVLCAAGGASFCHCTEHRVPQSHQLGCVRWERLPYRYGIRHASHYAGPLSSPNTRTTRSRIFGTHGLGVRKGIPHRDNGACNPCAAMNARLSRSVS